MSGNDQGHRRPEAFGVEWQGHPWERQPKEPPKAYSAFELFRDMDPSDRSVVGASKLYRQMRGLEGDSTKLVYRWSGFYRWVDRADAFDNWKDARMLVVQRRSRIRAVDRHARQAAEAQELAMAPIAKFREKIAAEFGARGQTFLDDLSAVDLMKLAKVFIGDIPGLQRAEREALASTEQTSAADPVAIATRGEIVRRMIGNPVLIGIMESVPATLPEPSPEVVKKDLILPSGDDSAAT